MSTNSTPTAYRPEVHGHRGCRGLLPENTIQAFLHALALGVDVLEMDVVISADNQVVVSHEPWLNPNICLDPAGHRIEPANPPRFNLYQMPYYLIRQCDCGQLHPDFPSQQPQPAHKPLLSEVLSEVAAATNRLGRAPVRFSIEIKSTSDGDDIYHPKPARFLSLVLAELNAAQVLPQTTLLCFDARILQIAHHHQPNLATCLLLEEEQPWLPSLQALGFVPTTLGPNFRTVTAEAVQNLRTAYPGLKIVPWTVNIVADMRRLITLQVEGITTDYPDVLGPLHTM
ncbi:glycerophosphodiester phosphodiesterase family protein [Hymenobacter negativus]|uniref:Glycerophosphodiester phosphodiesterase n=1 Tax=Hymenobacter negativus TaxID=2795026 RepID=A0ABS3QB03_9BACT|nr:glycerophosphodiester phosphodiesterase family protein [Hymenobacter negativus]MBO2008429.1 glycerophosphodiester phosphodiesterase [Hymenobacter negativus]